MVNDFVDIRFDRDRAKLTRHSSRFDRDSDNGSPCEATVRSIETLVGMIETWKVQASVGSIETSYKAAHFRCDGSPDCDALSGRPSLVVDNQSSVVVNRSLVPCHSLVPCSVLWLLRDRCQRSTGYDVISLHGRNRCFFYESFVTLVPFLQLVRHQFHFDRVLQSVINESNMGIQGRYKFWTPWWFDRFKNSLYSLNN